MKLKRFKTLAASLLAPLILLACSSDDSTGGAGASNDIDLIVMLVPVLMIPPAFWSRSMASRIRRSPTPTVWRSTLNPVFSRTTSRFMSPAPGSAAK